MEKIHIYVRDKQSGRFITHWIDDYEPWRLIQMAADEQGISLSDFVSNALRAALDRLDREA